MSSFPDRSLPFPLAALPGLRGSLFVSGGCGICLPGLSCFSLCSLSSTAKSQIDVPIWEVRVVSFSSVGACFKFLFRQTETETDANKIETEKRRQTQTDKHGQTQTKPDRRGQ